RFKQRTCAHPTNPEESTVVAGWQATCRGTGTRQEGRSGSGLRRALRQARSSEKTEGPGHSDLGLSVRLSLLRGSRLSYFGVCRARIVSEYFVLLTCSTRFPFCRRSALSHCWTRAAACPSPGT